MTAADPYVYWSADQIARASDCPLTAVQIHWPLIVHELDLCGIYTPSVCIGVIGTTAIEGASTFTPVREAYYLGEPEPPRATARRCPTTPSMDAGMSN